MRIPSGTTDQYIYFVAVDSTDFTTRKTGLTGFSVYRSRNGGTATAMTSPTINETDLTNMPGVYELLLDEDTTIDAGNDSEEVVLHISVATMADVTRSIELYRPKITLGDTLATTGGVVDAVTDVTTTATATDLTNLPSIPANWLTAAGTAADFVAEQEASVVAGLTTYGVQTVTAGQVTTPSTSTQFTDSNQGGFDDIFNEAFLQFLDGNNAGFTSRVVDYAAPGVFTIYPPAPQTIGTGDKFQIIGFNAVRVRKHGDGNLIGDGTTGNKLRTVEFDAQ